MKTVFAAALAIMAASSPARAERTASELLSFCQPIVNAKTGFDGQTSVPPTFEAGVCYGALLDFQSMLKVHLNGASGETTMDAGAALHICPPSTSDPMQMARIFDHYMRNHPESLNQFYWFPLASAMWQAFPCPAAAQ